MGEFASNGKANAGLTTGIIGTTLGGLWALGAGNGNGGILGGLLGGNNCQMSPVSALQSEVAMLTRIETPLTFIRPSAVSTKTCWKSGLLRFLTRLHVIENESLSLRHKSSVKTKRLCSANN